MATRSNRAATAANKKGGKNKRRNQTVGEINSHKSIDWPGNQRAFRKNQLESVARRHNVSAGKGTEAEAFGVPESSGYTPKHPRAKSERGRPIFKDHFSSKFKLSCPNLRVRSELDPENTIEGKGRSPFLSWSGAPPRAEEFVLIFEDVEAAGADPYVHWLVYRIPASVRELPEGIPQAQRIASVVGTPLQGRNSRGTLGYVPPAPPVFDSWHHYRFRLFALEAPLQDLRPGMTREEVMEKMTAHLLDETELICRSRQIEFKRKRAA